MSVELVCCHSCAGRNPVSFVLRFLEVLNSHRSQAGSGPAATSFLCFAKERKQRKATTLPLAFGFPIVRVKKWESLETRLRLKHKAFFIHFLPRTIGSVRSGLKSKAKLSTLARYLNGSCVCVFHSCEGIVEGFDQYADRSAIGSCLQTRVRGARGVQCLS